MATDTVIFDKIQALLSEVTAEEAIERVEAIERQIEDLREEQSKWRSIFGLKQQLGEPSSESASAANLNRAASPREGYHRNVGPLSFGVLDYVRSFGGRPVRLADITAEMVRRELVPPGGRGAKRVSVTAARLVDRLELERAGKGYYKLPSEGMEPEEEEREMTLDVATD